MGRGAAGLQRVELLQRFVYGRDLDKARAETRKIIYDPRKATEEAREGYTTPTRIRGYDDALYELAKDARHDKRVDCGNIRAPVLILWAEGERILPRLVLGRLKRRFPKAQVVTIEKAGHLLLEEHPKECNEAILRFLMGGREEAPEAAEPVDRAAAASCNLRAGLLAALIEDSLSRIA